MPGPLLLALDLHCLELSLAMCWPNFVSRCQSILIGFEQEKKKQQEHTTLHNMPQKSAAQLKIQHKHL